jgi:hypothetical protein
MLCSGLYQQPALVIAVVPAPLCHRPAYTLEKLYCIQHFATVARLNNKRPAPVNELPLLVGTLQV